MGLCFDLDKFRAHERNSCGWSRCVNDGPVTPASADYCRSPCGHHGLPACWQGTRTDLEPVYDIKENFPQSRRLVLNPQLKENFPEREQGQSREAIAKTAGVSGRTVDKVKAIRDDAIPEVQTLARAGAVSIHAASQIADLPERQAWLSRQLR